MKTDPSKACANEQERFFWAFIHDLIAHPVMAILLWSKAGRAFHNWTSKKAWPRPKKSEYPKPVIEIGPLKSRHLIFHAQEISQGVWKISHPSVRHDYVTTATDSVHAYMKAYDWFKDLSDEFGGNFSIGSLL